MKPEKLLLKYFSPSDNLFIHFAPKTNSVGEMEHQEDVILYKENEEIKAIEILHFREFKGAKLQISSNEVWDFDEVFKPLRMVISLEDILGTDEFERTCEAWNLKVTNIVPENKGGKEIPFDASLIKKEVGHQHVC
jgi:hypothetical protein